MTSSGFLPGASRRTGLRGLLLMSAENDAGLATHRAIVQMKKMLLNMDAWFGKAVVHARVRSFDPEVFLGARGVYWRSGHGQTRS